MKIIVAADKNWGIGKDNKLLVSIPADMKMFRQETTGKVFKRKPSWETLQGLSSHNTNLACGLLTKHRSYQK